MSVVDWWVDVWLGGEWVHVWMDECVCVVCMGMVMWVDVIYVDACMDVWVSGWAAGGWKSL